MSWFTPSADPASAVEDPSFEETNVSRLAALSGLLAADDTAVRGLAGPLAALGFDEAVIAGGLARDRAAASELDAAARLTTIAPSDRRRSWTSVNADRSVRSAFAFLLAALQGASERESAMAAVVLARHLTGDWPPAVLGWDESPVTPVEWDADAWRTTARAVLDGGEGSDAVRQLVERRLALVAVAADPVTRSFTRALGPQEAPAAVVPLPPRETISPASPPDVSLLVHGTNSWQARWWRPGTGTFHDYVRAEVRPNLSRHGARFGWDGYLRDSHRTIAAHDLVDWAGELAPDGFATVFSHSYGADVVAKAALSGLVVQEWVLLSAPVNATVEQAVERIARVVDIRLTFDPVLAAAAVQQRVTQRVPDSDHVTEVLLGWTLDHEATHDPAVWRERDLAERGGLV